VGHHKKAESRLSSFYQKVVVSKRVTSTYILDINSKKLITVFSTLNYIRDQDESFDPFFYIKT